MGAHAVPHRHFVGFGRAQPRQAPRKQRQQRHQVVGHRRRVERQFHVADALAGLFVVKGGHGVASWRHNFRTCLRNVANGGVQVRHTQRRHKRQQLRGVNRRLAFQQRVCVALVLDQVVGGGGGFDAVQPLLLSGGAVGRHAVVGVRVHKHPVGVVQQVLVDEVLKVPGVVPNALLELRQRLFVLHVLQLVAAVVKRGRRTQKQHDAFGEVGVCGKLPQAELQRRQRR